MHVSVFNPAAPQAAELLWLWKMCIWVCGFVLAAVTLPILYIVLRYGRRDNAGPPHMGGNTNLEIIWTLIPVALVGFLFVLSIKTARAVDDPVRREPDIIVTGQADAITANAGDARHRQARFGDLTCANCHNIRWYQHADSVRHGEANNPGSRKYGEKRSRSID